MRFLVGRQKPHGLLLLQRVYCVATTATAASPTSAIASAAAPTAAASATSSGATGTSIIYLRINVEVRLFVEQENDFAVPIIHIENSVEYFLVGCDLGPK